MRFRNDELTQFRTKKQPHIIVRKTIKAVNFEWNNMHLELF